MDPEGIVHHLGYVQVHGHAAGGTYFHFQDSKQLAWSAPNRQAPLGGQANSYAFAVFQHPSFVGANEKDCIRIGSIGCSTTLHPQQWSAPSHNLRHRTLKRLPPLQVLSGHPYVLKVGVDSGGTLVADWGSGLHAIGFNQLSNSSVVGLNLFPDIVQGAKNTDTQRLVANAITFSLNGGGVTTVPEPATMLLLCFGLVGLAGVRRFKK